VKSYLGANIIGDSFGERMGIMIAPVVAEKFAFFVHEIEEDRVVHQVVIVLLGEARVLVNATTSFVVSPGYLFRVLRCGRIDAE